MVAAALLASSNIGAIAAPISNPCELITRTDAAKALGKMPRPGVHAPSNTCAYFGASTGYVRISFMAGGMSGFIAARKNALPDVVDISGIGSAAYYIKGEGEIINAVSHGTWYAVTLHFQSNDMKLANPPKPLPQEIALAKTAASRF
ncbi:MAG: hypothetical protein ACYDA1_03500 [Vulcanimicrobiaceae bacterium]